VYGSICDAVRVRRAPRLALADAPARGKKAKEKGKKKKKKGKKAAKQAGTATAPQASEDAPEAEDGGPEEEPAAQEGQVDGAADSPGECSICLTELEGGADGAEEEEVVLECNHRFHESCLDVWVSKCSQKRVSAACPYCRGALRKKA
jgi:hypothetical protein